MYWTTFIAEMKGDCMGELEKTAKIEPNVLNLVKMAYSRVSVKTQEAKTISPLPNKRITNGKFSAYLLITIPENIGAELKVNISHSLTTIQKVL